MPCGYGLIHGTKRRKDNQWERLNHLYKQNTQSSFDNSLKAPKSYGAITFSSTWYQIIKWRDLNDRNPYLATNQAFYLNISNHK